MKRLLLLLASFWTAAAAFGAEKPNADFNLKEFAALPVVFNGRHQPIDSVAANALVQIRERRTANLEPWKDWNEKPRIIPATEWFATVTMRPEEADAWPVFRINNPEVISLLKLPQKDAAQFQDGKHYSWNQIEPGFKEIEDQARRVLDRENPRITERPTDASARTPFEQAVLKLRNALTLYLRLKNTVIPGNTTNLLADVEQFRTAATEFRASPSDQGLREKMVGQVFNWELLEGFDTPLILPPTEVLPGRDGWSRIGSGVASLVWGDQATELIKTLQDVRRMQSDTRTATMVNSLRERFNTLLDGANAPAPIPASLQAWVKMADAFRVGDAAAFNASLATYQQLLTANSAVAVDLKKAKREVFFNRLAPFYKAMPLYVLAFLLGCFYWFNFAEWARKSAFWLIVVAFVIHTVGLIFRMWLEGRPPVTNLYSSAIFIGWGSVGLGLLLEKFWRNAIGLVVGSTLGFVTLIVAHNLSLDGDTLHMLQAVLDTNFWLATHVVAVTVGYASTYVAGFLAIIFILLGVFTNRLGRRLNLDPNAATVAGYAVGGVVGAVIARKSAKENDPMGKMLTRMVYGIVCFATLFSFVGTVLGGIWADQSWGRFWGWDPKENGALIIVLWNALILHARWGGLVRERGLMNLAIVGNIVTSWSWFGTNMLGIGLHSYGFTSGAFLWLGAFIASQLALLGLGLLPPRLWRSSLTQPVASEPKPVQPPKGRPATA